MKGEELTPYRRSVLYETATRWATDEVPIDADADDGHVLIHALAETPDGPLEVREDFMDETVVPEDEHTPQEWISGWITFYGMPEVDPFGPVSVVVRVTAPLASVAERDRFDEDDLLQAVAASSRETYPVDGGEPVLPTFERVRGIVVDVSDGGAS